MHLHSILVYHRRGLLKQASQSLSLETLRHALYSGIEHTNSISFKLNWSRTSAPKWTFSIWTDLGKSSISWNYYSIVVGSSMPTTSFHRNVPPVLHYLWSKRSQNLTSSLFLITSPTFTYIDQGGADIQLHCTHTLRYTKNWRYTTCLEIEHKNYPAS